MSRFRACCQLLALALCVLVTACAGSAPARATAAPGSALGSGSAGAILLPPANGRFDYQIGGAYPPASGVRIVDRDWHQAAAAGTYGICYVNAFQTQPEDRAWWQANHPDLLLRDAAGTLVVDSVWNEVLLDLRTAAQRASLAAIVGGWVNSCAARGYRGVEFDNLDSFTRSNRLLTYPQARAYAALIVGRAHTAGLAAAQKNTVERSTDLRRTAGFDFAIVEECQVYNECAAATDVYGAQVYELEYLDNGGLANYHQACAARGSTISVTLRDRQVVPQGSPGYSYRTC